VDGVARAEQDRDGGASESDFRVNVLSALPVIAKHFCSEAGWHGL